MIEFFQEGGWGMWAILFVGLVLLAGSARFAYRPESRHLGALGMLGLATIFSILTTTVTDLGTVFFALTNKERIPDDALVRVLFEGLKECTRPAAFGTVILCVASLLVAAGLLRQVRPAAESAR